MTFIQQVTVESLCDKVTTGGTPSRQTSRYWDGGTIGWFKTGELNDWYLGDAEELITEDGLKNSAAKIFPPDTVLIALYGDGKTITTLGLLRKEAATNQACCAMLVNPLKCNHLYLFYALKFHRRELLQLVVAGAQRNLSNGIIRNFKINYHPRDVQNRIVQILSAYDDLIENNRRRKELLEASARHLYEEWFVRLRFPGHEHTKIVNGVPEGWEISPLEEVAEFRLGKMLDQIKNKGEERPYLANVNVRWGQIDLNDLREMRFEEHEMDAFGLKYGDIVMCEGGEPGRCAIWKDQLPGMMIQKAIHRIRARAGVDYAYLYYCLRHLGLSGQLATLFTGATIKHLPREKLAKVSVMVPNARLADLFREQVHPIERQIALFQSSSRKASEARDLLLPRLMSGEVAI